MRMLTEVCHYFDIRVFQFFYSLFLNHPFLCENSCFLRKRFPQKNYYQLCFLHDKYSYMVIIFRKLQANKRGMTKKKGKKQGTK
jgi:hypothetical protein